MKMNLNDTVLVTEKARGRKAYDAFYRELNLDPNEYRRHAEQPDGRLKMQLWEVMRIYGGECGMGFDPPIETTFERIG